jgi:uncharacterized protein involved in exopolysaccharide biosynthesis
MTAETEWSEEEEAGGLQVRDLLHWSAFALQAVWRRRRLAAVVLLAGMAVTFGATALRPTEYEVEVRVLANSTETFSTLVNPRRSVPQGLEQRVRAAAERIRSRQSRARLIDMTNLQALLEERRGSLAKLQASMREAISGPPDPVLVRAGLLVAIDKSLSVSVAYERVIIMRVVWNDAAIATALAQAALEQLMETERDRELAQLNDTIEVLDRSIGRARARLSETSDRLEALIREKESDMMRRSRIRRGTSRTMSFRRPGSSSSDEAAQLDPVLQARERALREAERTWQRQRDAATTRLARLRESLGPQHPDVRDAERAAAQASVVPAELEALRAEVESLIAQEQTGENGPRRFQVVQFPLSETAYAALTSDPEVESVMTELRDYITQYNDILDRKEDAELEVDMARTGFAHRYDVTKPPVMPLKPRHSVTHFLQAAGLVFSLLFAVLVCAVADLRSGLVLAAFQVERATGLPLLDEQGIGNSHDA